MRPPGYGGTAPARHADRKTHERMHIWLIKDGEQLPSQPGVRLMRMGMLAATLRQRGHEITWWNSTFSHPRKALLAPADQVVEVEPGYTIRMVHGGEYRRNISWRRYVHHKVTARRFAQQARELPPPDAIVVALPTIDFAHAAFELGREWGIPVIVDVRDPWPKVFIDHAPRFARPFVRALFRHDTRMVEAVFRGASSVVATTGDFLRWAQSLGGRGRPESDRVVYLGHAEGPGGVRTTARIDALLEPLRGKVLVTFIGVFGRSYELDLVLDIAERLRDEPSIQFCFAGDGEHGAAIRRAAERLPNVTVGGWLDGAEGADLLARSDIGLIPCALEPRRLPNKAFEYFAAGLPIISSLEGEMAELLEQHDIGLSYRCGDGAALERHIRTLAADPARRARMAANSRALYEREFVAASLYAGYADHVEQVAEGAAAELSRA